MFNEVDLHSEIKVIIINKLTVQIMCSKNCDLFINEDIAYVFFGSSS